MRRLINIALSMIITFAACASFAQVNGLITAKVIDQRGAPVAGATVQMLPDSKKIQSDIIRECLTNKDGVCSEHLIFGRYHIAAMKKSDGYPNLTFNFYGHGKWPATATITRLRPKARVRVRLGPKAARLALTIVDAVTGKPLKQASVTLRPATDKRDFLLSNLAADTSILVPPNEDVLVEISADGYKRWHTTARLGAKHTTSIRLQPGERRELTIRLQPK